MTNFQRFTLQQLHSLNSALVNLKLGSNSITNFTKLPQSVRENLRSADFVYYTFESRLDLYLKRSQIAGIIVGKHIPKAEYKLMPKSLKSMYNFCNNAYQPQTLTFKTYKHLEADMNFNNLPLDFRDHNTRLPPNVLVSIYGILQYLRTGFGITEDQYLFLPDFIKNLLGSDTSTRPYKLRDLDNDLFRLTLRRANIANILLNKILAYSDYIELDPDLQRYYLNNGCLYHVKHMTYETYQRLELEL